MKFTMTTKSDAADAMRRTMPGRCSVNARVGDWSTDAIASLPAETGSAHVITSFAVNAPTPGPKP